MFKQHPERIWPIAGADGFSFFLLPGYFFQSVLVLLVNFPQCMSEFIPEDPGQGSEMKDTRAKLCNVCADNLINSKLLGQYHHLTTPCMFSGLA